MKKISRREYDTENDYKGKSINNINIQQINIKTNMPKKKKSHSLMKKNELVFPKINNNNNLNDFDYFDKRFSKLNSNGNNINKKKNQKLGIHDTNNLIQDGLLKSDKNKDIDGDKNNNRLYPKNETLNIQKIKTKIQKCPSNNINIKTIHDKKLKSIKKETSNLINTDNNIIPNSLLHPIPGISSASNNYLFQNKSLLPSNNSLKLNSYTQQLSSTPPLHSQISSLSNTSKLDSQISNPASSIGNRLQQIELMNELLQNLFSSPLIPSYAGLTTQKTVELTPDIFNNTYKNFEISITSNPGLISDKEIIKGYAFNSSIGKIRDYNEDTITATKVELNDDKNDYFYFFGVYDGHGGKGCSLYLKENLHKNIKEFSPKGLKQAIDITEEKFKIEEALSESGGILDSSGSCGCMAMIKNNKCIIANVGDSRLILFKNGKVSFATEDHKPGTESEKRRIQLAGGTVYQTPTIFGLYQNGKKIEIPWRVLPGRLSVSRTFGDIEAKDEKFGGMAGVVVAAPDITELVLDDEYNFMVIGCDGIFDVLSNEEILECLKIVLKEKKIEDNINDEDVHELCGDFAAMIIKSAMAKDSFDNVSCIVVAFNINDLLLVN